MLFNMGEDMLIERQRLIKEENPKFERSFLKTDDEIRISGAGIVILPEQCRQYCTVCITEKVQMDGTWKETQRKVYDF